MAREEPLSAIRSSGQARRWHRHFFGRGQNRALGRYFCSVLCIGVWGCHSISIPSLPLPPQTRVQTFSEALRSGRIMPPPGEAWLDHRRLSPTDAVGLLELKANDDAALISWEIEYRFSQLHLDHRITIVDPSEIAAVVRRQEPMQIGNTDLTDRQKAVQVGQLVNADYLFSGRITRYHHTKTHVTLETVFDDGELERYREDYTTFMAKLLAVEQQIYSNRQTASSPQHVSDQRPDVVGGPDTVVMSLTGLNRTKDEDQLAKIQRYRQAVKAPEVYEAELRSNPQHRQALVATVGIEAKLIDVRTGEYVWLFHLEIRDTNLQFATDRVLNQMFISLLEPIR